MIFIVLICPLGIGISDDSDEKIGVIEDSLVATSSLTTVETVKRCSEWRLNYIYGELQGLDKNFVTQHKASAIETGWRH